MTDNPTPRQVLAAGYVCSGISLFLLPILFGPAAIVLGVIAIGMGSRRLGAYLILIAIAAAASGMWLGTLLPRQ